MRKIAIVGFIAFGLGLLSSNLIQSPDISVIKPVQADVAGTDRWELRRDLEFKRAVENIVENIVEDCTVWNESISC